ncbi:hypothetical protein BD408DRAFT_220625 [Parasitella parasitica]|nr:hypothetical protein BD408DRAFT_220625 [Parasitella parasitica]
MKKDPLPSQVVSLWPCFIWASHCTGCFFLLPTFLGHIFYAWEECTGFLNKRCPHSPSQVVSLWPCFIWASHCTGCLFLLPTFLGHIFYAWEECNGFLSEWLNFMISYFFLKKKRNYRPSVIDVNVC